ncbi:MAG: hypothetical protein EBY21_05165 [Alphaproteobacteria bacterium]|nr:hypothetical protein [Alphaproteobacteria bacterium]
MSAMALEASDEPIITTSYDSKADTTQIRASIRIKASPKAVWFALSDCDNAPKIIPDLESCKVIDKDPASHWDIREHVISPRFLPRLKTIVRNEFTPCQRLKFKLLEGDLRLSDGSWTLKAQGDTTLVSYEAVIALKTSLPQFIISQSIESDFPKMLKAIQKASLQQTKSPAC